jgi:hypothetical protein
LPSNDRGIFTEPLPSNDKGIFTEPFPGNDKGIFTEPLPSNDKGGYTDTHTHKQQRDLICLLLFFQNSVMKSARMRCTQHVTCMGKMGSAYTILVNMPKERDLLGDLVIDGRIVLKWALKK